MCRCVSVPAQALTPRTAAACSLHGSEKQHFRSKIEKDAQALCLAPCHLPDLDFQVCRPKKWGRLGAAAPSSAKPLPSRPATLGSHLCRHSTSKRPLNLFFLMIIVFLDCNFYFLSCQANLFVTETPSGTHSTGTPMVTAQEAGSQAQHASQPLLMDFICPLFYNNLPPHTTFPASCLFSPLF